MRRSNLSVVAVMMMGSSLTACVDGPAGPQPLASRTSASAMFEARISVNALNEFRGIDFVRLRGSNGRSVEVQSASYLGQRLSYSPALPASIGTALAKSPEAPVVFYRKPNNGSASAAMASVSTMRRGPTDEIQVQFPIAWDSEDWSTLYEPEQIDAIIDASVGYTENLLSTASASLDELKYGTGIIDTLLYPDPGEEPSPMVLGPQNHSRAVMGASALPTADLFTGIRLSRSRVERPCDDLEEAVDDAFIDMGYAVAAFGVAAYAGAFTGGASLAVGLGGIFIYDYRYRRAVSRFARCMHAHPEVYGRS